MSVVQCLRASGRMINRKGTERKFGLIMQFTKVSTVRERSMGKGASNGPIIPAMRENSSITISRVTENTNGETEGSSRGRYQVG
jgi:hypothetical protein